MSFQQYGPWSIVIGGSEGIGQAFAFEVAHRGSNVAVVARSQGTLDKTAEEIRARHEGVEVRTIPVDLTADDAIGTITTATADIEIGCLVYNVGSESVYGDFVDHDWDFLLGRLQRNMVVKTALVHHFANLMRNRGRGAIVLMGSIAGFGGSPGFAHYAASKAYSHTLGEALWYELKKHGVDVITPVVGPTNTPTMVKAFGGFSDAADPSAIARGALDHLGHGPIWIDGGVEQAVAERIAMTPADRAASIAERTAALASGRY